MRWRCYNLHIRHFVTRLVWEISLISWQKSLNFKQSKPALFHCFIKLSFLVNYYDYFFLSLFEETVFWVRIVHNCIYIFYLVEFSFSKKYMYSGVKISFSNPYNRNIYRHFGNVYISCGLTLYGRRSMCVYADERLHFKIYHGHNFRSWDLQSKFHILKFEINPPFNRFCKWFFRCMTRRNFIQKMCYYFRKRGFTHCYIRISQTDSHVLHYILFHM